MNNSILYDDELFTAGLWRVSDMFDSSGVAIGFNTWKTRGVSKSKFMLWRSLISKIRSLKLTFTPNVYDHENSRFIHFSENVKIDIETCTSKVLYKNIVKLKLETPTSLSKYVGLIHSFTQKDKTNMFLLPRLSTRNNVLKEFQFKILHRYLPTNALLFKMKMIASNKCTFCNLYEENITHLLYECFHVKNVWLLIQQVLLRITNKQVLLDCITVIFGYDLGNIMNQIVVNNIILHTKYYIWNCRSKSICPNYAGLKIYVEKRKDIGACLDQFYEYL